MQSFLRRMVGEDGKPIKSDADHQFEYGDRMPTPEGERISLEYFVLPEVFRTEICRGFDHKAVCKVLLQHGCIKPAKGREYDAKHRLPGLGPAWCYHFTQAIMELDV